jgi:hypothetical protein
MSSTPVAAPAPLDRVMQIASGYILSAALYAATKLGIPDLLQNGPHATEDLAKATNSNEDALYRTLRCVSRRRSFQGDVIAGFRIDPCRRNALRQSAKLHAPADPVDRRPISFQNSCGIALGVGNGKHRMRARHWLCLL